MSKCYTTRYGVLNAFRDTPTIADLDLKKSRLEQLGCEETVKSRGKAEIGNRRDFIFIILHARNVTFH